MIKVKTETGEQKGLIEGKKRRPSHHRHRDYRHLRFDNQAQQIWARRFTNITNHNREKEHHKFHVRKCNCPKNWFWTIEVVKQVSKCNCPEKRFRTIAVSTQLSTGNCPDAIVRKSGFGEWRFAHGFRSAIVRKSGVGTMEVLQHGAARNCSEERFEAIAVL